MRLTRLALLLAAVACAACSRTGSPAGSASVDTGAAGTARPIPPAPSRPQAPAAPRGVDLARTRIVALYGAPGVPGMGALGDGSPDAAAARLVALAKTYDRPSRRAVPAFEVIATLAEAMRRGDASKRIADAQLDRYLAAARKVHALFVIDIQPGHRAFLAEARHYARWLASPDVSLALDSEWKLPAGVAPGSTFGSTDAAEVNGVAAWLAGLVAARRLPPKLLIVHRFTESMVANAAAIVPRPGLAIVFNTDGFGLRSVKTKTYEQLRRGRPFYNGYKLFFTQDTPLMTPAQTLELMPAPDLVDYQ